MAKHGRVASTPANLLGTRCGECNFFIKSKTDLSDLMMKKMIKEVLAYTQTEQTNREDMNYRIGLLEKYLNDDKTEVPCMPFPELDVGSCDQFVKTVASNRPRCMGNNIVQFQKFGDVICDCGDQLWKRFREFIVSGMCHLCQVSFFERAME